MMNPRRLLDGESLERYRPYLYFLARSYIDPLIQGKLDPSDAVQQTLLQAYERRDQFQGQCDATLVVWLRQILVRTLADALREFRRLKRDVTREQSFEAAIEDSLSRIDQWLAAIQSSPSQHVAKEEDLVRLQEALSNLPEAQRHAIELHHLQGLTLAEVSGQLGRSDGAVVGLRYRGMKRFRNLLE